MLAPLSEGGMGMSSHEITEWGVFFQIRQSEMDMQSGGNSTKFDTPQVMGG